MRWKRFFIVIITFVLVLGSKIEGKCTPGVTSEKIIIGASNAQSGPAQSLGKEYTRGFKAYFEYINKQGGIFGRKLELIVYDDGYNPYRAIANTKKLIEEDKVFILAGYVGTPT